MSTIKPRIGDLIEVRIERIVPRGLGLGFAGGMTIFTALAVPGDLVTVRLTEIKKKIAFAEIVEIKEPGAARVEPPCKYFGSCGGCDFQQMSYDAQLEAKAAIIRDCLRRIGKIDVFPELKVIASPRDFRYRTRVRWHLDRNSRSVGYFRRDSHDVIDVDTCPILDPAIDATLETVRQNVDWDMLWDDISAIEAAAGSDGSISISRRDGADPAEEIVYEAEDDRYAFSADVFFQGNIGPVPELVAAALEGVGGTLAWDLYCGVGLFTLPLARRFEQVTGVEGDHGSTTFARSNVQAAALSNVEFVAGAVREFLTQNRSKKPDLIVLDPPRSGTERQTMEIIAGIAPAAISYVSCEPSMLARDLRVLLDSGYTIDAITAVDLFPQTHHVETVARLSRK